MASQDAVVVRNADGSINLKGFLKIKDSVPENVENTVLGGKSAVGEACDSNLFRAEAARYAHWNWCQVNLFGENGLPLAPFVLEN